METYILIECGDDYLATVPTIEAAKAWCIMNNYAIEDCRFYEVREIEIEIK